MARRTSQHTRNRTTRRESSQSAERSSRSLRAQSSTRESEKRDKRSSRVAPASSNKTKNAKTGTDRRSQRVAASEERKRQRTKERANRMYDRQVAASTKSKAASQEDGGPRAALYEGKMGSTHRKSARMQRTSEASPVSAKINPAGWFSNLNISTKTLRVVTAVICVVLVGVFLYIPAKNYYQAQREHDKLAAEYAVVEQRNNSLDEQNDALASDAGMEDAVRQKYGYVSPGEETAVVTGLSESTVESQREAANVEGNVLSSSVKAPEQWYTPLLDAFFGVE